MVPGPTRQLYEDWQESLDLLTNLLQNQFKKHYYAERKQEFELKLPSTGP